MAEPRAAKLVIDQAIKENRPGEYLCYGFAILFVVCGMGIIIWGAIKGEGLIALSGAIASGLFWPALNQSKQIRRENIAIRLLEAPLANAKTAEEASLMIKNVFLQVFANGREGK